LWGQSASISHLLLRLPRPILIVWRKGNAKPTRVWAGQRESKLATPRRSNPVIADFSQTVHTPGVISLAALNGVSGQKLEMLKTSPVILANHNVCTMHHRDFVIAAYLIRVPTKNAKPWYSIESEHTIPGVYRIANVGPKVAQLHDCWIISVYLASGI
jgi:hypothetical protein